MAKSCSRVTRVRVFVAIGGEVRDAAKTSKREGELWKLIIRIAEKSEFGIAV